MVKSELKELFRTVLICVSLHFSSHNLRFFDTRVHVSFGLYVNRGVTAESLSLGQHTPVVFVPLTIDNLIIPLWDHSSRVRE
jgi:hypothetical protein